MYKMRKVFDITDMPEDTKKFVYNYWREKLSNRSYIEHEVEPKEYLGGLNEEYSVLDAFLEGNGCIVGEQVIILYWW